MKNIAELLRLLACVGEEAGGEKAGGEKAGENGLDVGDKLQ